MAEIKKSDIVVEGIDKEFDSIAKSMDKVVTEIDSVISAGEKLNDTLRDEVKTQKAVNDANTKAQLNSDKLAKSNQQLLIVEEKLVQTKIRTANATKKQTEAKIKANKLTKTQVKLNKSANDSYNRLEHTLKQNIAHYNTLSAAQRTGTKSGRQLLRQINQQDKALKKLDATMGKAQRNVGNYGKAFSGLKNILGAVGFAGAAASLVSVFRSMAKTVTEFSSAQSKLASVLGKTKSEITDLTEDSLKYGKVTEYTATQVTELQTELSKLGFTSNEIKAATKDILSFATATGGELADAAKVTGIALRAFGLDAEETGRVTSTLAVATTKSALSFADYETILSTVAPVAKKFGFSIEDTIALTGKLRDAGFDASSAATATRNILLNLADGNGKLAKSLGRPINSIDDMAGAFKELDAKGISLAESLDLTDKRSVAAFNTFLTGTDDIIGLRDSITGVNEEMDKMVAVQLDNLTGDVTKLGSAWDGLILSVESGNGVLSKAARYMTNFVTAAIQATDVTAKYRAEGEKAGLTLDKMITKNGELTLSVEEYNKKLKERAKVVAARLITQGHEKEYVKEYVKGMLSIIKATDDRTDAEKKSLIINEEKKNLTKEEIKAINDKNAKLKDAQDKADKAAIISHEKLINDKIRLTKASLDKGTAEIKQKYLDEVITAKQATEEIAQLHIDAAITQIESLQELSKQEGLTAKERLAINVSLDKAKLGLVNLQMAEKLKADAEIEDSMNTAENAELESIEATKQATIKAEAEKKQAREDTFNAVVGFVGQAFSISKQFRDNEIAEIDNKNAYELNLAGDNEEEKTRINEKYDTQRKKLMREQANDDKNAAMFNILLSTAQAVVAALTIPPPAGYVLAAVSAALGAAELVAVQSKPIPKFKDGVTDFDGGLATVSDGNGDELIKTPNGLFLAKGEQMVNLPKHSDVFTAEETKRMLSPSQGSNKKDIEVMMLHHEIAGLRSDMRQKEEVSININQEGLTVLKGVNGRITKRLDQLIN